MATLKRIPDSYLTPSRTLPQQELADCYVTNPQAGRLLTYGPRDTRLSDPPHDHGQDGGEVLLDVPVCQLAFGPEKEATGPEIGIQIPRSPLVAAGDPTLILITAGVFLRAGQSQLSGILLVATDVIQTMTISVCLRPYVEANRGIREGLHVTTQLVFLPVAAPSEAALSFSVLDLTPLGDDRYDRELELVIWREYNPAPEVTSGHRLIGCYLDVSAVNNRAREAERSELPRQLISYADVKSGAVLGQDLGRKMAATNNGLLRGMLGRAPGLTNDGRSDPSRPYRQDLSDAHQHQGIDVPDGCGSFYSDGAVIRETLFAISFCHASAIEDGSGALLHSSGTFGATSLWVEARASIPSGLGAIDVRFELRVGTLQQSTRLLLHADVRGFDGVSICTGVSSGVHSQESEMDGDALYLCEVDPLDNNLFTPTRKRRLARAGLWTLSTLRAPRAPSGLRNSNHQISESVRLNLTQPKIDPSNTPHQTADYIVILRWELQTPEGGTLVDPLAKINWVLGLSSKGF